MKKTILIILVISISALTGNYYAVRLKKRADELKLIFYMLNEIEILIKYNSATVYEITEMLSRQSCLKSMAFIENTLDLCRNENMSFQKAWEISVYNSELSYFTKEDIDLINSIGQNLGTSGIDGQLSFIHLKQEELRKIIDESENNYRSKAKLYRSLGVLAGAFAAIFMI
jgi:stage III sporulation protein AB